MIHVKYALRCKKNRPRPIGDLSVAESFNETVGMDLKQWSSNLPVWFLHLVDHTTRYSSSCVIYTRKKEEIVRKLFQLVFGRNPNYPNNFDNQVPALEGKTSSQIVAENLNAVHSACKEFIKNESCEKLRRAMWHNIRTSQDTKYYSGDLVYYKQKDNNYWKGPGTVIGQDGQQVLVKHSSSYVRVHPCQLQLINNMEENELVRRESKLKEQENQIKKKDHNKTICRSTIR